MSKEKKSKLAKGWRITLSIIAIFLLLVIGTVCVYFYWPWHRSYFNNSDKEFTIPGLEENFVPQGMTEITSYNKYLISGYMSDGTPSRFYLVDGETKNVEKYFTLNIDGKIYKGHAGGLASYKNNIWTVSGEDGKGMAYRFLMKDIIDVENGKSIKIKDSFSTCNNADFTFVHEDTIFVGEFYKPEKYETEVEHHIETRSGETNRAMIYGFKIREQNLNGGLYDTFPALAISVRDLCQGIAITDSGNFILSTSYSIPNSKIYYYDDILNDENAHDTYRLGMKDIPLYYLDNDSLINEVEIPSMSEELFVKNDRVYILFESACNKYKLFNRTRIKSVYSTHINYFSGEKN